MSDNQAMIKQNGSTYVDQYCTKMKDLSQKVLDYINNSNDLEERYSSLHQIIKDQQIQDDKYSLLEFLHHITKIANNHERNANFFDKIEKILLIVTEKMKSHFTSNELFDLFKSNKKILLFLLKEKILTLNQYIYDKMKSKKYSEKNYIPYFYPEIKELFPNEKDEFNYKKNPEEFEEKRKEGENDEFICQLIRKDLIDELITYCNRNDYSLNSIIEDSIFETNSLLLKKQPTLIEYTAFYGSTQFFKYLLSNGAKYTSSLWIYAIHSENPEIIQILQDNKIGSNESYLDAFNEAIKCHHNETAQWIESNLLHDENNAQIVAIKSFNFYYFSNSLINKSFEYFCKYDYPNLVEILLTKIDNKPFAQNNVFI